MSWVHSGWGVQIDSVDQLMRGIARIGTLQAGERFVWRGVSNAKHAIQSSLQRALAKNREYFAGSGDCDGASNDLEVAERRIIKGARDWKLGFEGGVHLDDLHLLASLQHHGVPTRLLDVTEDPMTALWFACQKDTAERDASAVLFAFNVTRLATVATIDPPSGTWGHLEDPLRASLNQAISKSEQTHQPLLVS